ncbi:hypothetical protein [Methylomagnum sp.]
MQWLNKKVTPAAALVQKKAMSPNRDARPGDSPAETGIPATISRLKQEGWWILSPIRDASRRTAMDDSTGRTHPLCLSR